MASIDGKKVSELQPKTIVRSSDLFIVADITDLISYSLTFSGLATAVFNTIDFSKYNSNYTTTNSYSAAWNVIGERTANLNYNTISLTGDASLAGNVYTSYSSADKKLGVGTLSPTEKLEVAGNIKLSGKVYAGASTNSGDPNFTLTTKDFTQVTYSTITDLNATNYRTRLLNDNYLQSTGFSVEMSTGVIYNARNIFVAYAETDNKLGVGTTSPTEKLEVAGNVKVSGFISSTGKVYAGQSTNTGDPATTLTTKDFIQANYSTITDLNASNYRTRLLNDTILQGAGVLMDINQGITYSVRSMYVAYAEASNKLGVGTTTPTEKLDVVGNIKSSGKVYAGTSTTLADPNLTLVTKDLLINYMASIYPIGSIYISLNATNPATLFGFGTWVEYAAGRVLIGVGSATDTNGTLSSFAAGATGGAYNHQIASNEIPPHSHWVGFIAQYNTGVTSGTGTLQNYDVASGYGGQTSTTTSPNNANSWTTRRHNNVQPYATAYMWTRTG